MRVDMKMHLPLLWISIHPEMSSTNMLPQNLRDKGDGPSIKATVLDAPCGTYGHI